MALFDLELTEGQNVVSIPLILEDDAAKWSTILQGVAFNSIRTLTNGEWQDYLRGRQSDLNDFDSADYTKGYMIDVVRVGSTPTLTTLLPNTSETAINDYGDSVYSDETVALFSLPIRHTGAFWIRTVNADATNSDASYLTFTVDRDVNLYVCYDASASSVPTWLDDWDDTDEEVTAGDNSYNIYRLPVAAGAVSLPGNQNGGGNGSEQYLVFMEENPYPIEVTAPGYVYVAYPDAGCPLPTWLDEFDLLDEVLESSAINFKLLRKWFDAGTVTLGGASAVTEDGSNASPGANYLVGLKRIGPVSITLSIEGEEPSGIIDLPIVGKDKGGISLIGFPKSNVGETGVAENIDARGLQYETIMRLRKGTWDSYVPTRDETLNWAPADLERGLGYFIRSSIAEDQVLEIDYDS